MVIIRDSPSLVYELGDYHRFYILSVHANSMTLTAGKSVKKAARYPAIFGHASLPELGAIVIAALNHPRGFIFEWLAR